MNVADEYLQVLRHNMIVVVMTFEFMSFAVMARLGLQRICGNHSESNCIETFF